MKEKEKYIMSILGEDGVGKHTIVNDLFEGSIVTYNDENDLKEKINYYLTHEDERIKLAKKGQKIVLENHTFDHRIKKILSVLKENFDV